MTITYAVDHLRHKTVSHLFRNGTSTPPPSNPRELFIISWLSPAPGLAINATVPDSEKAALDLINLSPLNGATQKRLDNGMARKVRCLI